MLAPHLSKMMLYNSIIQRVLALGKLLAIPNYSDLLDRLFLYLRAKDLTDR